MKKSIAVLFSLLLLLEGCGTTTPSATDGGANATPKPTVESYEHIIGVNADQVTDLYVGYHIGPQGSWEMNTKDAPKINSAIHFLKNQQFTNLGKVPTPKSSVDITYDKISFTCKGSHAGNVDVYFRQNDNAEVVEVNDTLYSISSTPEEENNLFQELKKQ